jgi:hypothetical protein
MKQLYAPQPYPSGCPIFAGGVVDIARRGALGLEGGDLVVSACTLGSSFCGVALALLGSAGITTKNRPPSLVLISAASLSIRCPKRNMAVRYAQAASTLNGELFVCLRTPVVPTRDGVYG